MQPIEIQEINEFLSSLTGEESIHKTYVDNFHSTFIQTEEFYKLPEVPLEGLGFKSSLRFLKEISRFLPKTLKGFQYYQHSKSDTHSQILTLIKETEVSGFPYLICLFFELNYLGGANKDEILIQGTQTHTTSVLTKNIYYSYRILPIRRIRKSGDQILQFEIYPMYDNEEPTLEDASLAPTRKIVEIFDEVDHSSKIKSIKKILNITKEIYSLEKIYDPFTIEFFSPALAFLNIHIQQNTNHFSKFHKVFHFLNHSAPFDQNDLEKYHNYLKKHSFKRMTSRGGNVIWQISISED